MAHPHTHREKVDYFIEWAGRRGIGHLESAPLLWQLAWRLGYDIPPPHFLGFWQLFCFTGGAFAIPGGVLFGGMILSLMTIFSWEWPEIAFGTIVVLIPLSLAAGVAFGLVIAWYIRRVARKLALPTWENFPEA